jgi:CSLREA domain-containing protein
MPTIVVNTAADTIADDGKTSLREAIATAQTLSGHVDIVFDEPTFNPSGLALTINLSSALTISKGDIAIDGSLFFGSAFQNVKISAAGIEENALTVETGARVVLRDLVLKGSTSVTKQGKYGVDGTAGVDGVNGTNGYPGSPVAYGDGTSGTAGTDGEAAPNDADPGRIAVGGILNRGDLTLERVSLQSFRVQGGNGGLGGDGGQGGNGGNGERGSLDESHKTGGSGGNAGNGADGALGGSGGDAAAGIYNTGTLLLRDTNFSAMSAGGGNGGRGGDGGWGGAGGSFGRSVYDNDTLARGGTGGNGGDGGDGGTGGAAASAVFNGGTLKIEGTQSPVSGSVSGGLGGYAGSSGYGAGGGKEYGTSADNPIQDGADGIDGAAGQAGIQGGEGSFLGANVTTAGSFTIDAAKTVISEAGSEHERTVYFAVSLVGGASDGGSVKVTYVPGNGIANADFKGGNAPQSDTIHFSSASETQYFGVVVASDGKAEGLESFMLTLSDPSGGMLGWSKSVKVYITDGDPDGEAPTGIKLSDTSIDENTKKNTKLGALTTTDADTGDQFTYELINNAGGRFKLVGNAIKVADGTLLDYEQHKTHTIKVRSTDLFGNSVDKKFKIAIGNVDPEKLKGNASDNKLFGGAGKDTITGGLGNDTLKGNGDADRFVFDSKLDAATNVDHILDFKSGTDKLVLDKDIFTKLSGSTLAAGAFHTADVSHDPSDRVLYQKSTGKLLYDADGIKPGHDPILFAILDTHPTLGASDFLLV